jgi:hypothetical protein
MQTQSTNVDFHFHEPEALADLLHIEQTRMQRQSTNFDFHFHEPEALADLLHIERTRLAPQAHVWRLCPTPRQASANSCQGYSAAS